MAGGMRRNVPHGFFNTADNLDRKNVIQKFRVKIVLPCGRSSDEGVSLRVTAQLHGRFPRRNALVRERGFQRRQERRGNVTMYKADLLCVADRRTAGLCVLDDGQRHVGVSRAIDIDMADARAGLDTRHLGLLDAGANQPGSAARNEKIDVTHAVHQLDCTIARRILDQTDEGLRKARLCKSLAQCTHDGLCAAPRLFPTAQNAGVAALDAKCGSV